MDKKYNTHYWRKVKTTNIKNEFNLTFYKTRCLGHLECQNDLYKYFIPNGSPNETTWIGNIVHILTKDCFAPSSPYCKIYNVMSFFVNTCVTRLYYVMHKQENLT